MPIPALVGAALIGAGTSGVNMLSQTLNNQAQRKWNEKMYGIQRQDALADWQMQNAYNSPQAQMERLKEAGLNPNLVYGNGVTQPSQTVRSSSVESWKPEAPRFDGSAVLAAYYDTAIKKEQADLIKQQRTLAEADEQLKNAQTLSTYISTGKTVAETAKTNQEVQLGKSLMEPTIEAAKQNVQKMQADTQFTLDESERKRILFAPTLQKAVEEVLTMRANRAKTEEEIKQIQVTIQNLWKDNELKELDLRLKRQGVQPGDPAWMRAIIQLFSGSKVSVDNIDPRFYESLGIKPK